MINIKQNKMKLESIVILLIVWIALTFKGRIADTDIYHILLEGNYVLEHHAIHRINDSSAIDGMHMIAQQYGYDTIVAAAFKIFGMNGLIGVMSFFILAVLFLSASYLNYVNGSYNVNYFYAIMVSLLGFILAFNIRPSIVTISLLLMQMICTEHYIRESKKRWLLYILLTTIAEANMHMSYILFHTIFLMPYVVPLKSNRIVKITMLSWKQEFRLLITTLLTILAGCINPYGWKGCFYLLLADPRKLRRLKILELKSWGLNTSEATLIIAVIVCTALLIQRYKAIESRTLYGVIGCILLTRMAEKNIFFIGFALLWLLTDKNFKPITDKIEAFTNIVLKKIDKCSIFYKISILLVLRFICIKSYEANIPYMQRDEFTGNPVAAVEYLKTIADPETSKIFTSFNCGGILEYNGYRVLLDPRPELGNISINERCDILNMQRRIYSSSTKYPQAMEEYKKLSHLADFDYAMVDYDSPLYKFIENDDEWEKIYEEDYSCGVIYAHK